MTNQALFSEVSNSCQVFNQVFVAAFTTWYQVLAGASHTDQSLQRKSFQMRATERPRISPRLKAG
jgi:hypothetical protein